MRSLQWLSTLSVLLVVFAAAAPASDRPFNAVQSNAGEDCDANGVEDSLEIANDPVLDANFNGTPDRCEGLSVDRLQLSLSQGGSQRFLLDLGPNMAGRIYWVVGTTAGSDPGMKFGFTKIPLNYDGARGYMEQTLSRPNKDELSATLGALDADGRAQGAVTLHAGYDPSLAGLIVHHAFVIIDPSLRGPVWSSNAVSLELIP